MKQGAKKAVRRDFVVVGFMALLSVTNTASSADSTTTPSVSLPPVVANANPVASMSLFATVNGKDVSQAEFHATFSNHLRQKFYHGTVPEDQVVTARTEVTDQIINRILLLEEVERRQIVADEVDVEAKIAGYERRYGGNPNWLQTRDTVLPRLREQLAENSRLERLENGVREIPDLSVEEVRAFYAAKPELFTEPQKLHIASILLAVAPSSSVQVWDAAKKEAEGIVKRIRGGADFAEQARMFSNDPSAENGGDMGYLHGGVLSEDLQAKLDQLQVGVVSDPIDTLQGMAIILVRDRIPATLQPFEKVQGRARELALRGARDTAWSEFLAGLRSKASITIHVPALRPKDQQAK